MITRFLVHDLTQGPRQNRNADRRDYETCTTCDASPVLGATRMVRFTENLVGGEHVVDEAGPGDVLAQELHGTVQVETVVVAILVVRGNAVLSTPAPTKHAIKVNLIQVKQLLAQWCPRIKITLSRRHPNNSAGEQMPNMSDTATRGEEGSSERRRTAGHP